LWLEVEKYIIEQVMIDLFQQMMRAMRVDFIAIGSNMHAVTACAWFRRDRKGNIQAAHANVAFVGWGRLWLCCPVIDGLRGHF
jgi:hypothetical protein